jgi:death on curing protein
LLESALARPLNLAAYGEPDVISLAASYAFGLARNHPFIDGNRRTALVCAELFLDLNAIDLKADDLDCVIMFLSLAAGDVEADTLAHWMRENSERR